MSHALKSEALAPAEQAWVEQALQAMAPISGPELAALLAHARRTTAPKGAHLLQAGEVASLCGFVLSGGLREYYVLADGSERTKGFNLPGEFAGSLSDLLSGQASLVWISAEVPTTVVTTPWPLYQRLSASSPGWMRFARHMAEALYMRKVEREYELLALDAEQRYARARQRWPALEQVFSQKHIASYVGVTPVHLSRLRAAHKRAASPPPTPTPAPQADTDDKKG